MAGPYGSAFSGGYKQSPLAQALANAGQNLGQGLEKGAANYQQGQQFQQQQKARADELAANKRDQAFQLFNTESSQLQKERDDALAVNKDNPEAVQGINSQYESRLGETRGKYSRYLPELAKTEPTPTPQPAQGPQTPLGQAINSRPTAPQPAQQPENQAAPQAPQTIGQATTQIPKSFAEYKASGALAQEKQKSQETFDRAEYGRVRDQLDAAGYSGIHDRKVIPQLDGLDVSNLEGSRAALGYVNDYKERQRQATMLSAARAARGDKAYQNERELRTEYNALAKPYIEVIDNSRDIDSLFKQHSSTAQFGMLQKYARMLSPGIVTEQDMKNASKPGGVMERFNQEVGNLTTGQPITPEQEKRIYDAINSMTDNARSNMVNLDAQYGDLAKGYFGPGADTRIVNQRWKATPKAPTTPQRMTLNGKTYEADASGKFFEVKN